MARCPACEFEVPDGDLWAEVAHMKVAHPEIVEQRLRDAGLSHIETAARVAVDEGMGFAEATRWPRPRPTVAPKPDDTVQVVMSEEMARRFEARCLGRGNTVGATRLSPPLLFKPDDLPTYIIEA